MSALAESFMEIGGLLIGPTTAYQIIAFAPYDLPAVLTNDTPDPGGRGTIMGPVDSYAGAIILVDILVKPNPGSPELLRAAMDALVDALVVWEQNRTVTFRWTPPGYQGLSWRHEVRNRKLAWIDNTFPQGYALAKLMFQAVESPRSSDALHSGTTSMPVGSAGRSYPRTYPLVYGGGGTPGTISLTNAGNVPSDWVARIDGPCVNPQIIIVYEDGSVDSMTFDMSVGAGEFLQIDTAAVTVLHNGTVNRQNTIRAGSTWFKIPPGPSTIQFSANVYVSAAMLTVAWRDTRLG